jgi:tripartite-type tricarboxylate transporter receptor subunit TctC
LFQSCQRDLPKSRQLTVAIVPSAGEHSETQCGILSAGTVVNCRYYGKAIMKSSLRQTATPKHRSRPHGNNRPQPKTPSAGKHPRRQFLGLAAGAAALPAMSRIAWAQAYPTRPVRIVVGFPAGGGADISGRMIGQWLSERFGQPFIIENRPGAGSNIATESVVRAPPDGYTLLMISNVNAINAALYDRLTFNFIRDIAPVAGIMRYPQVVVVHPSLPIKTVPDLIAYAKANPGKLNMPSAGNGTSDHLSGELFKFMAGVDIIHVPYRGIAPALIDLLAGQVQVMVGGLPAVLEYIKAGRLRPLAVTTAARSEVLPEAPTLGQFVSGYETSTWTGIGAPKNTPIDVIGRLNREINASLADPKVKARLADLGSAAFVISPSDLAKLIADDTEKYGKVIRAANIKAE